MKNFLKKYWWIIAIILVITGVTIYFIVDTQKRSKGTNSSNDSDTDANNTDNTSNSSGQTANDNFPLKKGSKGARVMEYQKSLNNIFNKKSGGNINITVTTGSGTWYQPQQTTTITLVRPAINFKSTQALVADGDWGTNTQIMHEDVLNYIKNFINLNAFLGLTSSKMTANDRINKIDVITKNAVVGFGNFLVVADNEKLQRFIDLYKQL
jgi:hypothetical protein